MDHQSHKQRALQKCPQTGGRRFPKMSAPGRASSHVLPKFDVEQTRNGAHNHSALRLPGHHRSETVQRRGFSLPHTAGGPFIDHKRTGSPHRSHRPQS